jgi:hypothetical protein
MIRARIARRLASMARPNYRRLFHLHATLASPVMAEDADPA